MIVTAQYADEKVLKKNVQCERCVNSLSIEMKLKTTNAKTCEECSKENDGLLTTEDSMFKNQTRVVTLK